MKKSLFFCMFMILISGSGFVASANIMEPSAGVNIKNILTKTTLDEVAVFKRSAIFFQDYGHLKPATKTNDVDQLPVQGKRTFAKMFEGYKIKQAVRDTCLEGEVYHITLENDTELIKVKIDNTLEISSIKYTK